MCKCQVIEHNLHIVGLNHRLHERLFSALTTFKQCLSKHLKTLK